MIHLKKFTLREDWVPIKLDVSVEMPEELDISHLKGNGPQEGENILPEVAGMRVVYLFYKLCIYQLYIYLCLFRSSCICVR